MLKVNFSVIINQNRDGHFLIKMGIKKLRKSYFC